MNQLAAIFEIFGASRVHVKDCRKPPVRPKGPPPAPRPVRLTMREEHALIEISERRCTRSVNLKTFHKLEGKGYVIFRRCWCLTSKGREYLNACDL